MAKRWAVQAALPGCGTEVRGTQGRRQGLSREDKVRVCFWIQACCAQVP